MENEPVVTSEGMQALENKLKFLETTKRKEVSVQMKNALSHGDLSENAEYDEARKALNQLEKDIDQTATLIAKATVIEEDDITTDSVGVGCLVKVQDIENGEKEQEFRLVGPTESDPDSGKISHLCPIGMALMNSELGEVVSVTTPGGMKKYKILTISK